MVHPLTSHHPIREALLGNKNRRQFCVVSRDTKIQTLVCSDETSCSFASEGRPPHWSSLSLISINQMLKHSTTGFSWRTLDPFVPSETDTPIFFYPQTISVYHG
ncbi:hypothetical protein GOODEAATRI_033196 [Goodea atripinnis]|uniref:Uncharacterized protein n=1 Tax=Goodea atripinnis TaxID=208336 RepID=A0ABV0NQI1_9TELE